MSLRDATTLHGSDFNYTNSLAGDGYGVSYNKWEASSIQVCLCDENFVGPDCSQGNIWINFSYSCIAY